MLLAALVIPQTFAQELYARLVKRLLVLDDDPGVGAIITALAEFDGFQVRVVGHPSDFLGEVCSWCPTHVAIDLHVLRQGDIETIRALAERCSQVRVIILSADSTTPESALHAASGHGLHASAVLGDPITQDVLRTALATESTLPHMPGIHSGDQSRFDPDEDALRHALENHQFVLYYQPKICLSNGRLAGVEALVRWKHPHLGMILPDRFIDEMERSGDISCLTTQVLEQGLNWLSASGLPENVKLSLNLSANDLSSAAIGDRLLAQCRLLELAPGRLILELTETCALRNPDAALEQLTRLSNQGFGLALDDFGSGHSSMVHLQRHPFSSIKIDRSFVMSMKESWKSRKIVEATVQLGSSLGLLTIAEGVDSAFAAQRLRQMGCDWGQGYWIAPPMCAQALAAWHEQWNPQTYLLAVAARASTTAPACLPAGPAAQAGSSP